MTDPPRHDGYTWPVAPAGSRLPRERRPSRRPEEPGARLTRRPGVVAGVLFAVPAVWAPVFQGVEPPGAFVLLVIGIAVAVAATAFPALRSFAGGFVVASLVGGFAAFIALVVFFVVVFATMGP
ncbi:hypothetical protein [Terracoccus sp. 273MFTsu3.1]|uniref:hypothetical protein n=1 Tax=Terracoccus sp. 273MFTsu3.1 TaxID=1172188 RepID=UPI0003A0A64A|nr:hypothetical protein [Terracoccus sp. 273MFTsu3.1]